MIGALDRRSMSRRGASKARGMSEIGHELWPIERGEDIVIFKGSIS